MLFNSIDFAVFLPIVFLLYWFVFQQNLRVQNTFIVFVSFLFYGWWDFRFLGLIAFSIVLDYSVGRLLMGERSDRQRKLLLLVSLMANLGLLGYFKYFNFFAENFVTAFSFFGANFSVNSLKIILPVGISFYTFQTLSYTIDVYRRKLNATTSLIAFSAYVSFFPQLVAGPIERATSLLPQFLRKRSFDYDYAVAGLKQILWGLFKKVVIADNCAEIANLIFDQSDQYNGAALFLGAVFFAFQIYGDFSGYSDIAIGTSKLFGFRLKQNFAYPYFSRDIAEFWRRWHISLSTWFRDYLYIPLGGSKGSVSLRIRNTFIIFIVSGVWHGANWTFVFWGVLNALYFLPLLLSGGNRKNLDTVAEGRLLPTLRELVSMACTFFLIVIAWIFFRADNVGHAITILSKIFSFSDVGLPNVVINKQVATTCIALLFFLCVEWYGRQWQFGIEYFGKNWTAFYRYVFYYLVLLAIFLFAGGEQDFIYFQF